MAKVDEATGRRGVIGGSARVLRELLRTPRARRSVEIVLENLDPESAPELVEAALDDPALALDLIASAPAAANAGALASRALAERLLGFPPRLVRSFVARLIRGLDAEEMGRAAGAAAALAHSMRSDEVAAALESFGRGLRRGFDAALVRRRLDRGALLDVAVDLSLDQAGRLVARAGPPSPAARAVERLSQGLVTIARENPAAVEGVLRPLAEAIQQALAVADEGEERDDAG